MHANTVFLLGLGLLLVVGRGFGYLVPDDGVDGKRNEAEEGLGRSDELNRLELKEEEGLREEEELDLPTRSSGPGGPGSQRWYKSSAAGAGASWRSSAARYGMRNEENLKENEVSRLAALKYMEDDGLVREENEMGMRSSDYDRFLKNPEEEDFIMREDPAFELYYRYLNDPLREYEEEIRSMDDTVIQESDSITKRILETLRESTPQIYFRLLENVIRNEVPSPSKRGSAASAAAGWRSASPIWRSETLERRRAAAAAAAAAARNAARSAAAAAAAAGRRSPVAPIPSSYRLTGTRSAAAAAAAARSAAAAAAAAGRRSAAAAAAAAGYRNLE